MPFYCSSSSWLFHSTFRPLPLVDGADGQGAGSVGFFRRPADGRTDSNGSAEARFGPFSVHVSVSEAVGRFDLAKPRATLVALKGWEGSAASASLCRKRRRYCSRHDGVRLIPRGSTTIFLPVGLRGIFCFVRTLRFLEAVEQRFEPEVDGPSRSEAFPPSMAES